MGTDGAHNQKVQVTSRSARNLTFDVRQQNMKKDISWSRVADCVAMLLLLYIAAAPVLTVRKVEEWPVFTITLLCLCLAWGLFRNSHFARRCTGILFLLLGLFVGCCLRLVVRSGGSRLWINALALAFFVTGAFLTHWSKTKRPGMFRKRQSRTTAPTLSRPDAGRSA